MVTIQDIAAKAGVSASTVSRALADSPLVNQVTKLRVQRIADERGYQVNQVARSLATRATAAIGLVVPEVMNPYFPKVIHLVVQEARCAGYSVLLSISGALQQEESDCLKSLRERRADGIILVTGANGLVARDELDRLHRQRVPIVVLGWAPGTGDVDLVTGDDAAGACELTRHLIGLGHRRIVLVGPKETRGPYDRIAGFQRALAEAGLPSEDSLYLGVSSEHDVQAALNSLLGRQCPPTAIFAYQDTLAAWMLKHLQDTGVTVPDQVAIVGFDNLDLASYLSPHLTTVDYPVEAFAERAVSLLVARMKGGHEDDPPRRIVLTPHLVVRSSCGAGRSLRQV